MSSSTGREVRGGGGGGSEVALRGGGTDQIRRIIKIPLTAAIYLINPKSFGKVWKQALQTLIKTHLIYVGFPGNGILSGPDCTRHAVIRLWSNYRCPPTNLSRRPRYLFSLFVSIRPKTFLFFGLQPGRERCRTVKNYNPAKTGKRPQFPFIKWKCQHRIRGESLNCKFAVPKLNFTGENAVVFCEVLYL